MDMDLQLDDLMEQRIQNTFGSDNAGKYEVTDERLKEMNKKLPSWSLEPPFSFLK